MTSELHKKFDVAARTLDLSSAIIKHDLVSLAMDMTSSAAADLIKWLARERISEAAFIHAMRLGQDLAEPNIRGLQIIDGLNKTASRLCGLQLVMPGSLGRTIMFDDQLRWIGTTVAVLLKYHLPITVTSILASLFISTAYPDLDDPRRDITDSRIRPVLFKVVDSVHLQVVNAGHESKPLPEALRAVRHYFASSKLAEIIKSIRDVGAAKTSVFVEMYGCVVDVIDWILHHWPGRVVISLDHSIVMDEQLGEEGSCLTLMIDTDCEPDTNIVNTILTGSSKPRPGVHVGVVSGFGARPGSDRKPPVVPASSGRAEPRTRTGLYEFQNPFETIHMTLTERERKQAHLYAQEIVRSLVELPVEAVALGKWLVMKQVKNSKTKFSWWLKQAPSILQRNLGQPAKPRLLRVSGGTSGTKNKDPMQKHKASDVVGLYEELAAGVALVQERCECGGCKGDFVSDPVKGIATRAPVVATASLDSLNHGCLCTVMLMEMVLIIGHAMSEASGAVDVSQYSGKQGARGIAQVVMNVLGSVATKGEIRWESWLAMVSTFIGGVARDEVHDSATAQTNGLPRAKLQTLLHVVGSITIAPSWLVLESPLRLQGSWAVEQLLGAPVGIQADIATVEMQQSSKTRFSGPALPAVSCSAAEDIEDQRRCRSTARFSPTLAIPTRWPSSCRPTLPSGSSTRLMHSSG